MLHVLGSSAVEPGAVIGYGDRNSWQSARTYDMRQFC